MRIDLVGTTADFRGFGPRRSLPINHLLCENRQTAGRIGQDGLVAAAIRTAQAREPAKQHRIAIVIPAGDVAVISETSSDTLLRRLYQPTKFEFLINLKAAKGTRPCYSAHLLATADEVIE